MQRREGYTTLTICQPLRKTSRKSFHSGEEKADMNKQFLLTMLYCWLSFCLLHHCSNVPVSTGVYILVLRPQQEHQLWRRYAPFIIVISSVSFPDKVHTQFDRRVFTFSHITNLIAICFWVSWATLKPGTAGSNPKSSGDAPEAGQ